MAKVQGKCSDRGAARGKNIIKDRGFRWFIIAFGTAQ